MLECITVPVRYGKEAEANASLELFIELAEVQPSFFEDDAERVVSTMLAVARASNVPEETMRYATEMIVSLAEARPGLLAKMPGFVPAVLEVLLKWMTENEEDESDWENFDDDNEMTNYAAGREGLDRLCVALGKKKNNINNNKTPQTKHKNNHIIIYIYIYFALILLRWTYCCARFVW